jgi:hypothetical protein
VGYTRANLEAEIDRYMASKKMTLRQALYYIQRLAEKGQREAAAKIDAIMVISKKKPTSWEKKVIALSENLYGLETERLVMARNEAKTVKTI